MSSKARLTCWVATMFGLVFLSQANPGYKRPDLTMKEQGSPIVIRIVDQNGRQVPNGVPSAASQIFDVAVGQGFAFVPNEISITTGDTVRWTWVSSGHSVTGGAPCIPNGQFCSPDDTNCAARVLSDSGTVYEHTFDLSGDYSYFCAAHCEYGMTGVIHVSRPQSTPRPLPTPRPRPSPPPGGQVTQ
jgi:plastocyanin